MASGLVTNREISWDMLIRQADPEFDSQRRREKLFEFSNGRIFRGDPERINTAYPKD